MNTKLQRKKAIRANSLRWLSKPGNRELHNKRNRENMRRRHGYYERIPIRERIKKMEEGIRELKRMLK